MKQKIITIKNLHKSYGSKKVTDNVSVSFYTGEIVALVGHNGAGKTTFLNQLNGMLSPDSGSIYINGREVTNKPHLARELVSSMPQFQAPLKGVTIQQAIECVGAMKGMKKTDIATRSEKLMNYLAIHNWRHTAGEKLSGGLQRLTSFAMSVITNPPIAVLDEPTNDVDPYRRSLMWRYLRELANQGTTVIIVTHNLFEVERYADRYLIMEKGHIRKDMSVSDMTNKHQLTHQVSMSILDEEIIGQFSQMNAYKYDDIEKRVSFMIDGETVNEVLSTILILLEKDQIISYDIKLKNILDDYEEYINDN